MQIGFLGILNLIFITLKLTDYIDWSWWWVMAPLWVPFAIVIVVAAFVLSMGGALNIKRKSK